MILPCPVFKRKIHSAGAKIASADSDLDRGGILLALLIQNLAVMHLPGKICDFPLLFRVKRPFILSVGHDCFTQLSPGQLMKNKAFFTGIDHCTVVQFLKLVCKLSFRCKITQQFQNVIIHLLGSKRILKSGSHRNRILSDSLPAGFTCHSRREVNTVLLVHKILISIQFVQVSPLNHRWEPPF